MKKKLNQQLAKIASEVRNRKTLDLPTFCDVMNLGPSTFYNYAKLVTYKYPDIHFLDGMYRLLSVED